MAQIRIEAPAKLNLHLNTGEKRPDGFHDIESLFLALAFGDTLYIETTAPARSLEIHMNWQLPDDYPVVRAIPPEKNLISRAVDLFRDRTGYEEGLKISVEKRIPPGGGLGGGSSDAAAVFLALNYLASSGCADGIGADGGLLDVAGLAELAASVGSDVPFFIYNCSAAWVSGRGERVVPVTLPEAVFGLSFLLINAGFRSDTAEAYRQLDLYRKTCFPKVLSQRHKDTEEGEMSACGTFGDKLLQSLSGPPCDWPFSNDFLPVFIMLENNSPHSEKAFAYRERLSGLRKLGADFTGLSGSGSTCFGVFLDRNVAATARKNLLKQWRFVIETFPLAPRTIRCYNQE